MNSKAILVFSSLALSSSLALAQAPAISAKPKLDPIMEAVQQKFNIFDQDFSAFNKLAQDDAISGPRNLELSVKMKEDAQNWFSAMQSAYIEKAKENKSLTDQNRNLEDQIASLRKENQDLTRKVAGIGGANLVRPLQPPTQPSHLMSHPIK